ncbi:hypothetical protein HYH03_010030 [Edaphochlamys debaryana]|uniref:Uncharacterized protein n=1 Tax=Edaphochlamys debaryana TaxID=47281 RepID=A0A835Y074_9CHLO|nr:hypothetical protein HYH03_010030 [Edaphochlamys debaryana]|eukprot:KAG2491661.1 hypothetical protein HYH03_010030 [Edaphochlamys debaryana]
MDGFSTIENCIFDEDIEVGEPMSSMTFSHEPLAIPAVGASPTKLMLDNDAYEPACENDFEDMAPPSDAEIEAAIAILLSPVSSQAKDGAEMADVKASPAPATGDMTDTATENDEDMPLPAEADVTASIELLSRPIPVTMTDPVPVPTRPAKPIPGCLRLPAGIIDVRTAEDILDHILLAIALPSMLAKGAGCEDIRAGSAEAWLEVHAAPERPQPAPAPAPAPAKAPAPVKPQPQQGPSHRPATATAAARVIPTRHARCWAPCRAGSLRRI